VDDQFSVIVLMNLGEDDEAAMPTRMADNVAAIYIPGLDGSAVSPHNHTPSAAQDAISADVATIDGIIDVSFKALRGPVGAPRDWSRYRALCDPAIRLTS
jgi:hypothetical protein